MNVTFHLSHITESQVWLFMLAQCYKLAREGRSGALLLGPHSKQKPYDDVLTQGRVLTKGVKKKKSQPFLIIHLIGGPETFGTNNHSVPPLPCRFLRRLSPTGTSSRHVCQPGGGPHGYQSRTPIGWAPRYRNPQRRCDWLVGATATCFLDS